MNQQQTPPVSPTPPSPIPISTGKPWIKWLLTVGVIAVLSSAATVITMKMTKDQTPEQKACTQEAKVCPDGSSVSTATSSADMTNWKTYSAVPWAKKYGNAYSFSIKYPPDWKLIENALESSVSITLSSPDYQTDKSFVGTVIKGGFIAIIIEPNSTLDRWSNTSVDSELKTKQIISSVGNLGSMKMVEREYKVDNGNLYSKVFAIGDAVYEFRIISNESPSKYTLLLDQILSTFTFLE